MATSNRRRFAHLFAGASAAQLAPFIAAPLLTRLYSPTQFAALATFVALAGIWGTIASARYHMAILLPRDDHVALGLVRLSMRIALISSATLTALLALLSVWTSGPTTLAVLGWWLLIVPAVGALLAFHEALTFAMIRFDQTRAVASSSVSRALSSSLTQTGLGIIHLNHGLLIGSIVGSAAGNSRMYFRLRAVQKSMGNLTTASRQGLAHRYRKFALLDTPASLANILSFNLLVLGIGLLYSQHQLGQYALAYRVLVLPSTLVGTAIGQIYMRTAALHRQDRNVQAASTGYRRYGLLLALVSVPTFGVLLFAGEDIFRILFGDEWRDAGRMASALAPLLMIRFVASPLTSVFTVYERQGSLLWIQLGILFAAASSFCIARAVSMEVTQMLVLQSVLGGAVYLIAAGRCWQLVSEPIPSATPEGSAGRKGA